MKRNLILYILGVLIFILSIIGLTYAFMKPKVEEKQESTNISINSCAKVQLKDNGKVINLENAFPMDDDRGLETNPYEFTVSSTCEDYIGFNLYLTSLSDNQIADNNIHYAITSKSKDVLSEGILSIQEKGDKDFNSKELKELNIGIKGTAKNIYKVYSNNIPLQGESTYQLYLWIDKDASNETMGQSFKVGLSVKSYDREETGAEKLIATSNEDKTLYFHNTELKGGAEDDSYRYSGSYEEVKNYVCLDGGETTENECANGDADLYRIIGLFKNDLNLYEIKLIKYDYATINELGTDGAYKEIYNEEASYYKGNKDNLANIGGYYWTSSNNNVNEWFGSKLRTENLNTFFLNYLRETKHIDTDKLIAMHTWELNGNNNYQVTPRVMYDNEMNKVTSSPDYPTQTKTVNDKIGLIYVSDYGYAASPNSTNKWETTVWEYTNNLLNSNWMYMGLIEFTISRSSSFSDYAFRVNTTGRVQVWAPVNYSLSGCRPSFYLTSSIKIQSGKGSEKEPYRFKLN